MICTSKPLLQQEWLWIVIGIAIDLFAGFLLEKFTSLTLGEIVILVFVSNILVLQMRHYQLFSTQSEVSEKEKARIFYRRDDTLKMAESIQQRAPSKINAMWTQMPLDQNLKDYFGRTLRDAAGKGIHTTRLIDIAHVPVDEIVQHIDDSWSYLESETYKIVLIANATFEMIFTDSLEGIFFQSQRGGPVTLAITSPEKEFYSKISEMFDSVVIHGSKEFKPKDFGSCDHAKIEAWLNTVKTELVT